MHITIALLLATASASPAYAQLRLSDADQASAFHAGGFKRVGSQWRGCEDPGTPGYSPGKIEDVRDLNGDGLPEAIISEGSTYCFGSTEVGYALVSKQANGTWKLLSSGSGVVTPLATKAPNGWPDLEIGGPGFCFPVLRWNGVDYKLHRREDEGKSCRAPR